jgi:hypothetical protein
MGAMLQLDDQALARIVIGASRIPVHARRRWLEQLAHKLDPPKRARTPNAARVARHRAREAKGERCYRLVIDDRTMMDVLDALVGYGCLSERDTMEHPAIEQALAEVISAFAAGWRSNHS